jgi:hypothetical protein
MLNERERQHAIHRMREDSPEGLDSEGRYFEEQHNIRWSNLKEAITNWKKFTIIACNSVFTSPLLERNAVKDVSLTQSQSALRFQCTASESSYT